MTTIDLSAGWLPIVLEPGDAVSIPVTVPAGYETGAWTAAVYADKRQTAPLVSFTPTVVGQVVTISLTSVQVAGLAAAGTSVFTGYWELVRTVSGATRTWLKGDFIIDAARRSVSNGTTAVTLTLNTSAVTIETSAAAGSFQPIDTDLTSIAGLSPSAGDTLQYVGGAWVNRTPTQAKVTLGFLTRYTATVGDGSSTTVTVTHALGTTEVETQVRDASTGARVDCDVTTVDANTVSLGPFLTAPASNSLKVVVIG
jgi:hypothetical protein